MTAPVLPTGSTIPSRTSGTAPLAVFFDATATTDADTTQPLHDLEYRWSFGDSSPGNWTYGANTARNKNSAFGPVAAHCYESAGTFKWYLEVSDGTTTAGRSGFITVTAADTTFSTTTACIAADSLPVEGVNGVPIGATCVQNSDFDAEVATQQAAGKRRILLKRGDTFNSSALTTLSATGPAILGAYGSGSKPIIEYVGTVTGIITVTGADWRVMDLEIDGNSAALINVSTINITGSVQATLMNLYIHDSFRMIYSVANSPIADQTTLYNNVLTRENAVSMTFLHGTKLAVIGNSLTHSDLQTAEHVMRIPYVSKGVFSNNTMGYQNAGKEVLTIRGPSFDLGITGVAAGNYSEYVVVSDNDFTSSANGGCLTLIQQSNTFDERRRDIIVERNYFKSSTGASVPVTLKQDKDITLRNNLLDMTGDTGHVGFSLGTSTFNPPPPESDNIKIYNNTIYSADVSAFTGVSIQAGPTNTVVKNNLCYAPNASGSPNKSLNDLGTGTVASNNTNNSGGSAPTTATSPTFDGPLTSPTGFRIGTGSTYQNYGTAVFPSSTGDFFNDDDNTSNERAGAFVPRLRANGRGAGP